MAIPTNNVLGCRLCNNNNENTVIKARDMFLGTRREFNYLHCSKCSSLSIQEVPKDLSEFYKNYYSFSLDQSNESYLRKKIKKYVTSNSNFIARMCCNFLRHEDDLRIKSLLPLVLKNKKNARILDVGCGCGDLISELWGYGFENAQGIDPYLEKDILHKNGSKIFKKNIFEIEGSFDVIMFHHSFEHTTDPLLICKKIFELLSEDGVCIIRLPNVDSYAFRKFKHHWFGIHAPFHHVLPSYQAMQMLAGESNLDIVHMAGENLPEFFLFSMAHSLDVCDFEDLGARKYLKRRPLKTVPPLFSKDEVKHYKKENSRIYKIPKLCDWAVYYLTKKNKKCSYFRKK